MNGKTSLQQCFGLEVLVLMGNAQNKTIMLDKFLLIFSSGKCTIVVIWIMVHFSTGVSQSTQDPMMVSQVPSAVSLGDMMVLTVSSGSVTRLGFHEGQLL